MFNGRVRVGFGRGLFPPALDAVTLSHESAFLLALCAADASSCLMICGVRLKMEMDKAVFQVTVSFNIRKDSVAEALPFPWEWRGKLKQAARIAPSTSKFSTACSWQPIHALRNFGM